LANSAQIYHLVSQDVQQTGGQDEICNIESHRRNRDLPSGPDRINIFLFVQITFIAAIVLLGFWFLTQLISLGSVTEAQTGGVAYAAHVAGVVFGALTARRFEDPERTAAQR